jgi:hypothetical protein
VAPLWQPLGQLPAVQEQSHGISLFWGLPKASKAFLPPGSCVARLPPGGLLFHRFANRYLTSKTGTPGLVLFTEWSWWHASITYPRETHSSGELMLRAEPRLQGEEMRAILNL